MENIEWRAREAVRPYERNPRRNEKAVAKVAASIREFGWQQPIVVDEDDVILAGHTRLLAAEQLGQEQVPVVVAAGLDPSQRRAYRIADNRLAEYAKWDEELLARELRDLKATDFDLALTGMSPGEIRKYTDDVPEEQATEPGAETPERTKLGEVWQLGEHRILVGDCTNRDDVKRVLATDQPRLMVADPPYGVDYDPEWRNRAGVGKASTKRSKIAGDDLADWRDAWKLFPGPVAYVWHAGVYGHVVAESLIACKFEIRAQIIWAKPSLVIGRGHYHHQHEPCLYAERDHEPAFYAVRKGKTADWSGSRRETTLWSVAPDKFDSQHPTQKPVELILKALRNHECRTVYDPFLGTGTTLIAAEHEGRRCIGIELNPRWADVCIDRWERFTNSKAKRLE